MTLLSKVLPRLQAGLVPLILVALLLAVGACSRRVGKPPEAADLTFPVPDAWRTPAAEGEIRAWLDELAQPALTCLVLEARQRNPDLAAARATFDAAEAQVRLAGSRLGPQINLTGGIGRGRANVLVPASSISPSRWMRVISTSYDIGLSAAWELDLWGGSIAETRGAMADLYAAGAGLEWAYLSLSGQVARAWLRVITADRQVSLAQALLTNQTKALAVTEERFTAGIANAIEVHGVKMAVASAQAQLAEMQQQRELASQGLTGLLGRYPDAAIKAGLTDLPALPPAPGAGLPGELLIRRPDIRSAGLQVMAAGERIWSAKTAFFPRITLTAAGGYRSDAIRQLLDPERLVWNLLGGLTAPVIDGGRNRAILDLRRAQQIEALARYQATVLRAFGEVEGALATGERLQERSGHLAALVVEAEGMVRQAHEQYAAGMIGMLELQSIERQLMEAQMGWEGIRALSWDNRVALYLALGGAPLTMEGLQVVMGQGGEQPPRQEVQP